MGRAEAARQDARIGELEAEVRGQAAELAAFQRGALPLARGHTPSKPGTWVPPEPPAALLPAGGVLPRATPPPAPKADVEDVSAEAHAEVHVSRRDRAAARRSMHEHRVSAAFLALEAPAAPGEDSPTECL
eukprot:NODE_7644_length_428_cov_169.042895.p2 GENE.NODE_7644_length_428_cov_169.042895~~NODE_7644_length_428_cov_169.042895.p2  ORF type:complete len:131 (+),score=17.24 NODE_7644_length_428_cov_169.042895:3-395(+)